jgi:uncharacterized membrane protein (DUF2068 family)
MGKLNGKEHSRSGLRVVSLFEAAKGLLVLLTGFGLLALIHKDLHLAAEQLVRHFHLNPASHYPRIFIDLANHLNAGKLWAMAFAALIYSVVRFVEAFGLWLGQQWAKWFGLLTAGLYVPVELFEVIRGATWPKLTVVIVNVGIVGYLGYVLYQSKLNSKRAMK